MSRPSFPSLGRAVGASLTSPAAVLLAALVAGASPAGAQAWNYPALQVPSVSERDYTGALAAGSGSSMLFQWREGVTQSMHLGLDAGFADARGSSSLRLFVGGSMGYDLARATTEQPLDLLLTGGVGLAFGGRTTLFRVPVGVSMGHTFDLEEGMAITPFVHPRLSIDACDDCGRNGRSATELSLSFDVGASFRLNPRVAIRAAGSFTGSDVFGGDDGFAVGVTWTPASLRR